MTIRWASLLRNMLVPLTYKQIKRTIKFPVYEIPSEDLYKEDGLLFFNGKVLDDRNQSGKTLGERRLKTPHPKAPLTKAYPEFLDLIKSVHSLFIDSKGVPFRYERTKMCTVESKRIRKKISRETYSIISVEGVNSLYSLSRYPRAEEYAQILMLEKLPWLLYGISEKELKTFRKKI